MLHGKSMAGFVVLNNMAYDVMANEELMVFSTNSPFTILYFVYGAMHVCNYSQRSYTVVYDTSRIYSVMWDTAKQFWERSPQKIDKGNICSLLGISVVSRRYVVQPRMRDQPSKKNHAHRIMQRNHA
jgi:hypothetical protein